MPVGRWWSIPEYIKNSLRQAKELQCKFQARIEKGLLLQTELMPRCQQLDYARGNGLTGRLARVDGCFSGRAPPGCSAFFLPSSCKLGAELTFLICVINWTAQMVSFKLKACVPPREARWTQHRLLEKPARFNTCLNLIRRWWLTFVCAFTRSAYCEQLSAICDPKQKIRAIQSVVWTCPRAQDQGHLVTRFWPPRYFKLSSASWMPSWQGAAQETAPRNQLASGSALTVYPVYQDRLSFTLHFARSIQLGLWCRV